MGRRGHGPRTGLTIPPDLNLLLYAYNPQQELVRTVLVSTGKETTPTPIGEGQVYTKHRSVTMRGRGYVAPGVPWAARKKAQ